MSKRLRMFILLTLLLVALIQLGVALRISQNREMRTDEHQKWVPENVDLIAWIEKLADNENCGGGIIDSNGLRSYGDLCFQEATFRLYIDKYGMLPQCEPDEVMNWITDGETQRELAYKMIEDNYSNYDHWRTTVRRIGKPPIAYK